MTHDHTPNAETQAAIDEVAAGGLPRFDTVEALMADLNATPREKAMRELLTRMFSGWILREASYVSREGVLLTLFGHWADDIISMAAHYGIGLARRLPDGELVHEDGTVTTMLRGGVLTMIAIPAPPSPAHYWSGGKWHALAMPGDEEIIYDRDGPR